MEDYFNLLNMPGLGTLWSETNGIPEICVAIIDGPVQIDHPCLKSAHLKQVPLLGQTVALDGQNAKHGTQIASIIFGQNKSGLMGLAPRCRGIVIPLFQSNQEHEIAPTSQVDLARAIILAVEHGANIINISGGQSSNSGASDVLLADALQLCHQKGILVIAAAGNDGCECVHIPAATPTVLAVGAMDNDGLPLPFSNWGNKYQHNGVLFPGLNILCADPEGGLNTATGTSYSTAIASGLAALLLSLLVKNGKKPDTQLIRNVLLETALPCKKSSEITCKQFLIGALNLPAALTMLYQEVPLTYDLNRHTQIQNEYTMSHSDPSMSFAETNQTETLVQVRSPFIKTPNFADSMTATGILPSSCSCKKNASLVMQPPDLVYAIGTLTHEFLSEASRDAFRQFMDKDPNDALQMLNYLERNPEAAEDVVWVLNLDATPIYAIIPTGGFTAITYARLQSFHLSQLTEGAQRISIPGFLAGQIRLLNGQELPILVPRAQGMYSWSTSALLDAALGPEPFGAEQEDFKNKKNGVHNFLDRIYYELRNLGISPKERAINYAATNAFQIERVFESAIQEQLELDLIDVEKSPVCRPNSECWDIKLIFFHPTKRLERARKVYRFTVDVSHVIPVTVGEVRSWNIF